MWRRLRYRLLHVEKTMRVEVIGAGIAGLAVAVGLQRAGATVTVRERQPDATQHGSGLSLFGNGLAALDALGLAEAVRAAAGDLPPYASGLRRPDGRWLARFSAQVTAELRVIERQRLHDVLHEALRPGTVRFSAPVSTEDGSALAYGAADLVIAADGIRSAVRAGWPDDPGWRYAGYVAFRGITARPVALDAAGETWGRGRRFGVAPLADGRVYWFAALNGPREEPSLIDRSDLERLFADWHQPIGAILAATPVEAITLLPIDELARCPRSLWRDNVVLIGDAAHAMTPNLGQGANLALEDAATLALLLAPFAAQPGPAPDRLRRTLADYQRLRLPRVRAVGRRSRRIGVVGQWERPVAVRARDAVLAWLPDAPVSPASVALQAWRPTTRR
jgi:2-polyprenyl-6-methoxyphenol hydroxylase-like FAD-dependent oxidoreductase